MKNQLRKYWIILTLLGAFLYYGSLWVEAGLSYNRMGISTNIKNAKNNNVFAASYRLQNDSLFKEVVLPQKEIWLEKAWRYKGVGNRQILENLFTLVIHIPSECLPDYNKSWLLRFSDDSLAILNCTQMRANNHLLVCHLKPSVVMDLDKLTFNVIQIPIRGYNIREFYPVYKQVHLMRDSLK